MFINKTRGGFGVPPTAVFSIPQRWKNQANGQDFLGGGGRVSYRIIF